MSWGGRQRSECSEHDKGIRVTSVRVEEGQRQATDDFKAEALPQSDRSLVCADYKIELHGPEAALERNLKRMFAHAARHAAPLASSAVT
jgi:hypothetical protein